VLWQAVTAGIGVPAVTLDLWRKRAFNKANFRLAKPGEAVIDYDRCFYPLDAVLIGLQSSMRSSRRRAPQAKDGEAGQQQREYCHTPFRERRDDGTRHHGGLGLTDSVEPGV
jgi:hypothetical protein